MAPSFPWHDLLVQWSNKLITQNVEPQLWFPQARLSRWLGTTGATEEQIRATESQLKTTLPPAYRTFLATTNGWSVLTPFVWRVYPVEEIGWYGPRYPDNLAILRGDFNNNPIGVMAKLFGWDTASASGDDDEIPVSQLQSALEIVGGNYTDAVEYVLNPHVQTADGEWEAWIIRWWKPTRMERYASFWKLMQAEYHSLQ
jgi:hypothetical protein